MKKYSKLATITLLSLISSACGSGGKSNYRNETATFSMKERQNMEEDEHKKQEAEAIRRKEQAERERLEKERQLQAERAQKEEEERKKQEAEAMRRKEQAERERLEKERQLQAERAQKEEEERKRQEAEAIRRKEQAERERLEKERQLQAERAQKEEEERKKQEAIRRKEQAERERLEKERQLQAERVQKEEEQRKKVEKERLAAEQERQKVEEEKNRYEYEVVGKNPPTLNSQANTITVYEFSQPKDPQHSRYNGQEIILTRTEKHLPLAEISSNNNELGKDYELHKIGKALYYGYYAHSLSDNLTSADGRYHAYFAVLNSAYKTEIPTELNATYKKTDGVLYGAKEHSGNAIPARITYKGDLELKFENNNAYGGIYDTVNGSNEKVFNLSGNVYGIIIDPLATNPLNIRDKAIVQYSDLYFIDSEPDKKDHKYITGVADADSWKVMFVGEKTD
ncbi:hypothetical protein EV693_101247 [Nicoletella semolina]|uniref:Uncharacterized protein n=2 Tax=Nicoletella semolina TaxID=271160 RepID=A0A4R2NCY6_9PAST|nr:hypothetical protein [Nicoletella semolina]MDH2924124.1 hypothetical protein [Nicoletella semolina]TCP18980.1 hypothetical protein EV693_101247 [Nicoletella semolina]